MDNKREKILNENIWSLLIKFSLPTIGVLLVNAAYNLIDAIFVGNQVNGDLGIAGLTIVFPIQMLLLAVAQMVGMGSASMVSRYIGEKKGEKVRHTIGNAIALVFVLGLILTVVGLTLTRPILLLFGSSKTIYPYANSYFRIVLLGTVFYTMGVAMNAILRSKGKMVITMIISVISSAINIPLDYLFVVVLQKGVEGAAIATVLAQITSCILLLIYHLWSKDDLKVRTKDIRLRWDRSKKIMKTGIPSIITHAAGAILSIVIVNSLRHYGQDTHITILGIYNRTLPFVFLPMIGIMQALQPIIGVNYGAKQMDRVKIALRRSLFTVLLIGTVGFTVFILFTQQIIQAFSTDPYLIQLAVRPYRITILMLPVLGVQIIGAGYFQAMGKVKPAAILSLSRTFLFMIPLILLLPLIFKLDGIWYAIPLADVFSFGLTVALLIKYKKVLTQT